MFGVHTRASIIFWWHIFKTILLYTQDLNPIHLIKDGVMHFEPQSRFDRVDLIKIIDKKDRSTGKITLITGEWTQYFIFVLKNSLII